MYYKYYGWCEMCFSCNQKEEYAHMGGVEVAEGCFGLCHSVQTDLILIFPKCGCEKELVGEITDELNKRREFRGQITLFKYNELFAKDMVRLMVKMDKIGEAKGIDVLDKKKLFEVFGSDFKSRTVMEWNM